MKKRTRRFLAYDGEGIGKNYMLLGHAQEFISSARRLSTKACLDFIARPEKLNPIRVWFSFGYDLAHVCRDLSDKQLLSLYKCEPVTFGDYALRFIPRKLFEIRTEGRRVVHYDVWSFFDCSFESALRKWGIEVPPIIELGKAARVDFRTWSLEQLREYNQAECVALEKLMCLVRQNLGEHLLSWKSLTPRSWHGPGAVAGKILRYFEIGREVWPERDFPKPLQEALRMAYFGGRIEHFAAGTVSWPVYRYDLNSAYPFALTQLPRLKWRWQYVTSFDEKEQFALYHVRWDLRQHPQYAHFPGPLPVRDAEGYITFRADGEGWYWFPEVAAAMQHYPSIEILEGWIMPGPHTNPLMEPVNKLYALRQSVRECNPALAGLLKRIMNSLYGKFLQAAGSRRYVSLAWAGYITALIRAELLHVMRVLPGAILAVMTDGFLSSEKIYINQNDSLWGFTRTEYTSALILQPGVYRLASADGQEPLERWRGYNVRAFPWEKIIRDVRRTGHGTIRCPLFVSHPLAILAPKIYRRQRLKFTEVDRQIYPLDTHKRVFYQSSHPRIDLSTGLYRSRMVSAPEGTPPPVSQPYTALEISDLERFEREELEIAIVEELAI